MFLPNKRFITLLTVLVINHTLKFSFSKSIPNDGTDLTDSINDYFGLFCSSVLVLVFSYFSFLLDILVQTKLASVGFQLHVKSPHIIS